MNCKEIAESVNNSTEIIRIVKRQSFAKDITIILLIILLIIMGSYITYDRYLDSQFDIDTTEVEVIQDGQGYNNFIHGTGDIINGTESED